MRHDSRVYSTRGKGPATADGRERDGPVARTTMRHGSGVACLRSIRNGFAQIHNCETARDMRETA
eukprot:1647712-Prymnesium_polylepis.1